MNSYCEQSKAREAAERYALMWSGGKDSALALWRARRRGLRVDWLVNVYDRATARVRFHATPVDAIALQAEAAGVPLLSVPTDWATFDPSLRETFAALVQQGCRGIVFGDIHLADVRAGPVSKPRSSTRRGSDAWSMRTSCATSPQPASIRVARTANTTRSRSPVRSSRDRSHGVRASAATMGASRSLR